MANPLSIGQKVYRHPGLAVAHLCKHINYSITRQRFYRKGTDIFAEDWDVLIILDALREDTFQSLVDLPGQTEKRLSKGSATKEFIRGNCSGKSLNDVVCVSANHRYYKHSNEMDFNFCELILVDRDGPDQITSTPQRVVAKALEAYNKFDDKRILIHFMQPHQPFIGEIGQGFPRGEGIHKVAKQSDISKKDIIKAYNENTKLALKAVRKLMNKMEGRMVVTSDHGELLGDMIPYTPFSVFGHPEGFYHNKLITVPWHIFEVGPRRQVSSGKIDQSSEYNIDKINENLRDLGYK